MPEYLALVHHHSRATEDDEGEPPSVDEVESRFLAMERAGIARIH